MNGEKTQIEQIEESSFGKNVDWVLFSFGTLLLSLVVAMIVIFPDFSAASINRLTRMSLVSSVFYMCL